MKNKTIAERFKDKYFNPNSLKPCCDYDEIETEIASALGQAMQWLSEQPENNQADLAKEKTFTISEVEKIVIGLYLSGSITESVLEYKERWQQKKKQLLGGGDE